MTGSQTSVQIITTLRNAASGVLNVPSISLDDHRRRKIKMKIQKLKVEVGKKIEHFSKVQKDLSVENESPMTFEPDDL